MYWSSAAVGHQSTLLADLHPRETSNLDLLPHGSGHLGDELFDGLVGILHEGLREERAFLEELLDTALDDLRRDLLGLALFLGLLEVNRPLALDDFGRDLIWAKSTAGWSRRCASRCPSRVP